MDNIQTNVETLISESEYAEKKVFETLNNVDVSEKVKTKNQLSYLPWAAAWAEVKSRYPDATFRIIPQIMDEYGNTRFWHDDGHYGWVMVEVTICGLSLTEPLPILDHRNQPIKAEEITSFAANKSFKRCLTKCLALHGIGLYVFMGEDLPDIAVEVIKLKQDIGELVTKKAALSDKAKKQVSALCKKAEKEANPNMDDSLIRGNYKTIDDEEILRNLYKNLLAVRK